MKRSSAILTVVVLAVLGGLGYLASTLLRTDPALPDSNRPRETSEATRATDPNLPAPATVDDSSLGSPPLAERSEEVKAPSAVPSVEVKGEFGSIHGRVLTPKNEPIAAAEVELKRGPTMGLQLATLTTPTGLVMQTDAEGRYRFPRVEPNDDYLIYASHAEYGNCEAGPIEVKPNEDTAFGDIRLRHGVLISGVVTSSGRPVAAATVTVSNAMEKIRRFQPNIFPKERLKALDLEPLEEKTSTDSEGRYEFRSIPFDTFEITAEAETLSRVTKTSQANLFGGSAREHKIDFELEPAQKIAGRVVDENGNGIEGAKITSTIASQNLRCDGEALSDAQGAFTLDRLMTGKYFIAAECDGYTAANRAQIEAGTSDLELVLQVQGSVTGFVVDEETGAPVTAFDLVVMQSFKGRGSARPKDDTKFQDASGRFEVKNLDPGRYTIQATAEGYASSQSDEFEVERGQSTSGVRVPMNRGGSVAGTVVDMNGNAVKNALVVVRENKTKDNPITQWLGPLTGPGGDKVAQIRTGDDGRFRIELIVPDTYQIMVRHNKFAQQEVNDVVIEKNAVKELGRIELSRGGRVSGHAYDLEGRLLASATVVGVSKANDYRTTRANNEGFFEFATLPPGDYTFSINSFQTDPPINPIQMLVYAKNSAQIRQVADGDDMTVDLRLSAKK